MNRIEFIDILRMTLSQELPSTVVQENIQYYDEYISSMGDEIKQEEEIDRIGDPHLIAQTIINSYKTSEQYKYTNYSQQDYAYDESQSAQDTTGHYSAANEEKTSIWDMLRRVGTIALVVIIIFLLLRFAFQLFIKIGLPILVCYFLIKLIRGGMNK